MQPLTKEELDNWLIDPTTKKVRKRAEEVIQAIKDNWANGNYVGSDDFYQKGRIHGMTEIWEVEPDEI